LFTEQGDQRKQAVAFLKKSSAKDFLIILHGVLQNPPDPRSKKVFCFFFSKKKCLLSYFLLVGPEERWIASSLRASQ